MEMKYVMFQECYPVIFYPCIEHRDMKHHEEKHGPITSAAFMKVFQGKVVTFGASMSLGLGPSPEDAKLISISLGMEDKACTVDL